MKKNYLSFLLVFSMMVFFGMLFSGCTTRITDFTAISTRNLNIDADKGPRVTGEDSARLLFGLIPLTGRIQPNLKDAIDRALDAGKGDVLIDGVVYQNVVIIPLIYTEVGFTVEGTVASTKKK